MVSGWRTKASALWLAVVAYFALMDATTVAGPASLSRCADRPACMRATSSVDATRGSISDARVRRFIVQASTKRPLLGSYRRLPVSVQHFIFGRRSRKQPTKHQLADSIVQDDQPTSSKLGPTPQPTGGAETLSAQTSSPSRPFAFQTTSAATSTITETPVFRFTTEQPRPFPLSPHQPHRSHARCTRGTNTRHVTGKNICHDVSAEVDIGMCHGQCYSSVVPVSIPVPRSRRSRAHALEELFRSKTCRCCTGVLRRKHITLVCAKGRESLAIHVIAECKCRRCR